jgi:hypothetical protein
MKSLKVRSAGVSRVLLASAMAAVWAGCAAGINGTAGDSATLESPTGGTPPVVVASTDVDADLVYDSDGPIDDIAAYPSVIYGGVTVYYVGGRWYRHGRGGWGYFREEPGELRSQREMHERDPRWTRSPEAPTHAESERPGVAEPQGPDHAAPPDKKAPPIEPAPPAKKKPPVRKAPPRAEPPREPRDREERP